MENENTGQEPETGRQLDNNESTASVLIDFQARYQQAMTRELMSGPGFEMYLDGVRRQLRSDLEKDVRAEIREELYHSVRREVEEEIHQQQLQLELQRQADEPVFYEGQQKLTEQQNVPDQQETTGTQMNDESSVFVDQKDFTGQAHLTDQDDSMSDEDLIDKQALLDAMAFADEEDLTDEQGFADRQEYSDPQNVQDQQNLPYQQDTVNEETSDNQMVPFQILTPPELKQLWEAKMFSETTDTLATGPEAIYTPASRGIYCSSPRYMAYALEIIRRNNPRDKRITGCYVLKKGPGMELLLLGKTNEYDVPSDEDMTTCTAKYIKTLSQLYERIPKPATDIDMFAIAHWQLQCSVLGERMHTYRCLTAHPYYLSLRSEDQLVVIQQLVTFFDRRFTSMIARFLGVANVKDNDEHLRLGDGHWIFAHDGLDTGTSHDNNTASLFIRNFNVWVRIVAKHNAVLSA